MTSLRLDLGQPEQVKYAGGNAATLLGIMGESFVNAKLASTILAGVNLYDDDMTEADLQRACLRDANLFNVTLNNSDFRLADLQGSAVGEIYDISNLAWSTSGLFLAYTSDSTLVISDVQNEREVLKVPNISYFGSDRVVQFVPNKNCLLFAVENKLMSATLKNRRWNINTEKEFDHRIRCIAINDDGTLVAIEQSGRIIIWNHQTQSEYGIVDAEIDTHNLVFIPNSNNLVIAHSGYRLGDESGTSGFRVLDIVSGRTIYEYNNNGKKTWIRRGFDTDRFGHTLMTTAFGGKPTIWALPTFNIINEIPDVMFGNLCCSFDGKTIATEIYNHESKNPDFKLDFVDIATGKIKQSITIPDVAVSSLAFSPDGNYIAIAFGYRPINILDVNPASSTFGQCVKMLTKVNCHGMQISGAQGLQKKVRNLQPTRNDTLLDDTLLEFFMKRGAILDDEQKHILIEAQKMVSDTM